MAHETVPAADGRIDLEGARAALRLWIAADDEDQLSPDTAQVALRTVGEEMLAGWVDSPEAAQGDTLMHAAGLVDLAERSLWVAKMTGDDERIDPAVATTVVRALRLLDGVARPVAVSERLDGRQHAH